MRIIIFFIVMLLMACNGEPSQPYDRPGGDPDDPSNTYDSALAAELNNPEWRVVTGTVTILYNFGGVIMGRDNAGALYTIDLNNGARIDFNPLCCSLIINGVSQQVTEVKKVKVTAEACWYVIETKDGRVIYVTKP